MKTSLKQNFVINENLNDALFYNSLIKELNDIIENELSKSYEEINAEIIDECCLALESVYSLLNGETVELKEITNINSIINKYNLSRRKKLTVSVACAAATVLVVGMANFSVNNETVAEGNIFKTALGRFEELIKNEKLTEVTTEEVSETTTKLVSEQTTTPVEVKATENNTIKNIYLIFPPGTNHIYKNASEINLSNVNVGVDYITGESEVINISDCSVTIGKSAEDGETKIMVSYKGAETCIYVTVLSEEKQNPVTLTSIYGIFTDEYTINDMQIIAVYSDGSEVEIDKSECKIQKEFLSDTNEYIITVSYGDCSFQFLMEGEVTD
ncbi:MAG: bacterial Ig-like domain-containing protein [Clostridia bacterium]|nr:bacterial Ig-like domain-containing protein [Clostridia bacterium]